MSIQNNPQLFLSTLKQHMITQLNLSQDAIQIEYGQTICASHKGSQLPRGKLSYAQMKTKQRMDECYVESLQQVCFQLSIWKTSSINYTQNIISAFESFHTDGAQGKLLVARVVHNQSFPILNIEMEWHFSFCAY